MPDLKLLLEWVRGGRRVLSEEAVTMYHGTSERFLRRILKHGLQATPPERQKWAEHQATYGGAYLTPHLQVAGRYAGDATRKDGNDTEVIVIMRIETRSTHVVPDEDTFIRASDPFNHKIQQSLAKQFGWPSANPVDVLSRVKSGELDLGDWGRKWLENINETGSMSGGRSMVLSDAMIDKIMKHYKKDLTDLLRLLVVFKASDDLSRMQSYNKEIFGQHYAETGVPDDPKVARANFIKALDKFTGKIQQLASSKHKLRSLLDVTYRGKNRILGILTSKIGWTKGKMSGDRILQDVVVYGSNDSSTLKAMKDMSERFKVAIWKDRNGRVVWEK